MKFTLFLSFTLSLSALAKTPKFDNSKLFVKMKSGATLPSSALVKSTKHLFANNYIVSTSDATKLQTVLSKSQSVISTQKNFYATGKVLPKLETSNQKDLDFNFFGAFNDPKIGKLWSFRDAARNGISVNQSYVAPLSRDKESVIVAVVDTGVDYNHDDLKNIMWKNEAEIADNGIDDDNNGYIDDVFGIDTLDKNDDGTATGDPMGSHFHGTHVAGTIAAEQNNKIGIAGVASTAKIMAIRTVPDNADETDADVVESFLYAAVNGARLINCSFGKSVNEGGMIVNETIDYIGKTYGVLTFAAAGNDYEQDIDTDLTYPASFDSEYLVVVASTSKSGKLSFFSNIGEKNVDLAAPGSGIYSTIKNNKYGNSSGTSMATPAAVGVAAEVLSNFPELGPLELKKVIMESVTPVSRFEGKMVTAGRIDLYNSLKYVLQNYNNL